MEVAGAVAASLELAKLAFLIVRKIQNLRRAPRAISEICSGLELIQHVLRRVEGVANDDLTLETHLGRFSS